MSSLYAHYVRERTNKSIIETDQGFVIYSFIEPNTVYIEDIYTLPEFRQKHIATCLANSVLDIAKTKGCSKALGTVVPSANNSTSSLKVLLAYGMTLKSADRDFIVMEMEIK